MRIEIWAKQTVEVDDDVLRDCHAESCRLYESDTESLEGLLLRAGGRGDVDLPASWRLDDDDPMTIDELEAAIQEANSDD